MRMIDVFVGVAACAGAALVGCGSSSSAGSGGAGGGAASSGAGASSSVSASASSSSSSAVTSSSSSGMDPGAVCSMCSGMVFMMDATCQSHVDTCKADPDCAGWLACTSSCLVNNPMIQCYAACDQAASVVANLYQPIYDCICADTACKGECSFACP
jgi:hypothetical protein